MYKNAVGVGCLVLCCFLVGCLPPVVPVRVDGVTICRAESSQLGSLSGTSAVKLVFADKDGHAVRLGETDKKMGWLASVGIASEPAPSVYAIETNKKVSDVTIEIQKGDMEKAVEQIHSLYLDGERLLREKEDETYVKRVFTILLDEGKRGLTHDPTRQRREAIISFVEQTLRADELFNLGVLPFSERFPYLFRYPYESKQYIGADGRVPFASQFFISKAFLFSFSFSHARSEMLSGGGPALTSSPAMYNWLEQSAQIFGPLLSWPVLDDRAPWMPALFALMTDVDSSILDETTGSFEAAKRALLMSGEEKAIPFFAVLRPKPESLTWKSWDSSTRHLCQLSKVGGVSWGNVFQLRKGEDKDNDIKQRMDFAYRALKGHTSLDFQYKLSGGGLQEGTRYVLEFYLTLKGNKNGTHKTSLFPVRVEVLP